MGDDGRVYACSACPEGKAAVKVLEFVDFEAIPPIMQKKCAIIDSSKASQNDCDRSYGWRIDGGKLDSGIGIIPGIKQSIVMQVHIVDENHGGLEIEYQTSGFTEREKFVVVINGEERQPISEDTFGNEPSKMIFALEEKLNKIEIAFESKAVAPNNQAQILISRLLIRGSDMGGAVECKTCDSGSIANTRIYMCKKCSAGTQPNKQQSDCVYCPAGTFNPNVGESCTKCPDFTYQSLDRQYCQLYDDLIANKTLKFHPHLLSPAEVCGFQQNDNYCTENNIMGPIFSNPSLNRGVHANHLFFFSTHDEFDLDTYEYHEPANSVAKGFIFGLFSMQDATPQEIKDTLLQSQESIIDKIDGDCMKQLKSLKVKKNLGSLVEEVGEFSIQRIQK